jgi:selT/selW/selH-like putative selenoprotein
LKEALEKSFPDVKVDLIKSKGGAFEICHEDELIYSKIETGSFPANGDIIQMLSDRS